MVVLTPELAKSLPPTEVKKLETSGQDQLLKATESMSPKDMETFKKQLESGLPERISRSKKFLEAAKKYKPAPFEPPEQSKVAQSGNEELGQKGSDCRTSCRCDACGWSREVAWGPSLPRDVMIWG